MDAINSNINTVSFITYFLSFIIPSITTMIIDIPIVATIMDIFVSR